MSDKIIIYVIIISVIGSSVYHKWSQDKVLKKLYKYKIKQDIEEFMNIINSSYLKLTFAKHSLAIMKLNYYIDANLNKEALEYYGTIKDMKVPPKDKLALLMKVYGFALQTKNIDLSKETRDSLLELLNNKKDDKSKLMIGEINQLNAIYIEKDTSIIGDLIETFEDCENNDIKSLLCFRIAKLYYYMNDENNIRKYIKLAISYSENEKNKHDLLKILSNLNELK